MSIFAIALRLLALTLITLALPACHYGGPAGSPNLWGAPRLAYNAPMGPPSEAPPGQLPAEDVMYGRDISIAVGGECPGGSVVKYTNDGTGAYIAIDLEGVGPVTYLDETGRRVMPDRIPPGGSTYSCLAKGTSGRRIRCHVFDSFNGVGGPDRGTNLSVNFSPIAPNGGGGHAVLLAECVDPAK